MTGSSTVFEEGVRTPRRFLVEVSATVISISRYAVVSQCPNLAAQISGRSDRAPREFREGGLYRIKERQPAHEACRAFWLNK
jgi:hypothetical protein